MEDFKEELPLERRYEVLKSICREQILINETLKLEIKNLGETLQKVTRERNVLLNELLTNHTSCPNSLIDNKSSEKHSITLVNTGKRSPGQLAAVQPKKLKFENSSSEVKHTNTSFSVVAQDAEFEHSPWSEQDFLDDRSLGVSRQFDPSFSPPLVHTRVPAPKHSHVLNSFDPLNEDDRKASYESNIMPFPSSMVKRPVSNVPPPHSSSLGSSAAVSSQKPAKASLLVTNPLVSSTQAPFPAISSIGSPPKHISLPNRIISGSGGSVSSFPRSGPVQVKSSFSLSGGMTVAGGSGPSSTSTSTLRVTSGSAPGHRLLIQPSGSGTHRSVCINPPTHSSNYSSG